MQHTTQQAMNSQDKSKSEILRQKIYILVYGTNTPSGKLFDIILLILIVCSLITIMLETITEVNMAFHNELLVAEWIFTILFTLEYILRIYCIDKPFKYIFSFYGIIDLLAILPMYLSFFVAGGKVLSNIRTLRLFRLFRVLKLFHFVEESTKLKIALLSSRPKIIVFLYTVIVISFTVGTLMYFIEGPAHGFKNIPISIYWTIITLTTVGYGDIVPQTGVGQFLASILVIIGYGIIAVPTGIVSLELSKQKNSRTSPKKNSTTCPSCQATGHPENSIFCFKCGSKLL